MEEFHLTSEFITITKPLLGFIIYIYINIIYVKCITHCISEFILFSGSRVTSLPTIIESRCIHSGFQQKRRIPWIGEQDEQEEFCKHSSFLIHSSSGFQLIPVCDSVVMQSGSTGLIQFVEAGIAPPLERIWIMPVAKRKSFPQLLRLIHPGTTEKGNSLGRPHFPILHNGMQKLRWNSKRDRAERGFWNVEKVAVCCPVRELKLFWCTF